MKMNTSLVKIASKLKVNAKVIFVKLYLITKSKIAVRQNNVPIISIGKNILKILVNTKSDNKIT